MLNNLPGVREWHNGAASGVERPVALGLIVLLTCIVGFGAWAATAPLHGAIVASGTFVATGQNKEVQHLEGGIIDSVLVKEGDVVEASQILLHLDATAAEAKLKRLMLRRYRLVAQIAAIEAETEGREFDGIPPRLADHASDPEVLAIVQRQKNVNAARRQKMKSEQEVLRKEISAVEESITGFTAQVASIRSRLELFEEEISDKSELMKRQLVRKTELLNLQRSEAAVTGELGAMVARIADANERIARANQQIVQVQSQALQEAAQELRAAESELDDIDEQIRTSENVLTRLDVRSPVRGIVVKLNYHTKGGVVAAGATILVLLPMNDELVIEARVNPSQIANVHEGQDALVRLSSLNQRLTRMVAANVVYRSADAVSDAAISRLEGKKETFIVRVRIQESDLRSKVSDFVPTPGSPADIYIRTTERTFLDYIMRPVADSFSRAFREN